MRCSALNAVLEMEWAIRPEMLETIVQIARRENADPEAVAQQLGRKLDNTRAVTLRDGVAIVPLVGPIMRRANLFTQISGATSLELFVRDLHEAAANESVRAIMLDVDSPGGQAAAISEAAGIIRSVCRSKPVHAYVGGTGASAAYWLASACESLTVSPTAILGSIGVIAAFQRGGDDEITIVSSNAPKKGLTPDNDDGRAEVQSTLDALEAVFVSDVAKYRGVSTATVLSDFGQGGVKVGRAAVKANMADRLGTFEGTLRRLASNPASLARGPRAEGDGEYEAVMMENRGIKPHTLVLNGTYTPSSGSWVLADPADAHLAEDQVYAPAPAAGTFEQQIETARAAVRVCIDRAQEVRALREEEQRAFSAARREQLTGLREELDAFLASTAPRVSPDTLRRLQLESLRLDAETLCLPA